MKILLYTDNHFCSTSSIIRGRGQKYSLRLENQIKSINWAEDLAVKNNCDLVVCLGDFFDKPTLNDEELTAVKDIQWNNLQHYFIVGNHESSINGLAFNSTKALERPNFTIVSEPNRVIDTDGLELDFLPYIIESDRKPLFEYYPKCEFTKKKIIFSHNDIKGIQMGPVVSKDGFEINEIENECDLFLNGHLHNGTQFSKKGYNLGNLTGQNFGEDAFKYNHCAVILDTDTLGLEFIENPYAFNFYKLDINFEQDIRVIKTLKDNSVISIKCLDTLIDNLKEALDFHKDKVAEYRITTFKELTNIEIDNIEDFNVDYIQKFIDFCKEKIDNTEVLETELSEVCR